ncbi:MAG: carboxypeptidase-like regulatory domain-containing protein [Xanthomonadaceae bacterium]|nr:carboxypeptidase-like regulatory domain-containing protein [Xanthomonadaceae bacterium]
MTVAQQVVIGLIALAVALSILRTLRPGPGRCWSGRAVLVGLQIVAAALLYFMLFPPGGPSPQRALTVLTAGAEALDSQAWSNDPWLVALPEAWPLAGPDTDIARVPDLGSALRAAPGVERLRVVGRGLSPRDQQIAEGVAVEFVAAPRRPGLVALDCPETVVAGRPWSMHGRIEAMPGASVVLSDVAGREMARTTSTADGGFALDAPGAPAGRLGYALRVLDAEGQAVDSLAIPIEAQPGDPLKIALLSGAPNPELKYLRRWAIDAGLAVDSHIVLTRGARLGAGPARWDAANLAGYDLLVFDERAWLALATGEQEAIHDAVLAGLGVMIRLTGQPSAALRNQLAGLGFVVEEAEIARGVRLADEARPVAGSADQSPAEPARDVELARRPLRVAAADGAALVRETGGEPLGLWRGLGRGRVGVFWLTDSYRLVLAGEGARHAALWSEQFGVLARGRQRDRPVWQQRHRWPDRRAVVCGLTGPAHVLSPDGEPVRLILDPAAGAGQCAGFWPQQAGWHTLRDAGRDFAFYVHPADSGAGLRDEVDRIATLGLIAGRPAIGESGLETDNSSPTDRWPWFVGWLLVSGLLWWRERRGRQAAVG